MDRRDVLRTFAVGSAAALAGCSGDSDPADETPVGEETSEEVPAPNVSLPDGWEGTTPDSESRTFASGSVKGIVDWEAIGHTKRYENVQLRNRVKQETFEKFDNPLVVGFATRLKLDTFGGDVLEGAVNTATDRIENEAKSEFRSQMSDFGVQNVREVGTIREDDGRTPADFAQYMGSYTVDPIEVEDVSIPDVDQNSFTVRGGEIPIEGIFANWRTNGNIFIAGGVYPAENFTRSKSWEINDAVDLGIHIDLRLSREKFQTQVLDFAKSVRA